VQFGIIVLLTLTFLDALKLTTLTQLPLLVAHTLAFPSVSLKISSQPKFALIFPNRMFMLILVELTLVSDPVPLVCNNSELSLVSEYS
jgi:hypothetical protein